MSEQSADGVWCLGKRVASNKKIKYKTWLQIRAILSVWERGKICS